MHWDAKNAGSTHTPHARLLHNRLAYEVLEAVYLIIPAGSGGGPALDYPLNAPVAVHDYQNWIHQRLPESGLAKALAAGPDFLPDITVELPWFWRQLARLTAPRSYSRLAVQVARNLAWYLGAGTPPVTLIHKLRSSVAPALLITALLLLSLILTTGLGVQPWPVIGLVGLVLQAVVLAIVWSFGQDSSGKLIVNCTELYAYLLAEYAEPGPETENLVQSLLIELGRDTDNSNAALARRARKRTDLPVQWD